MDVLVILSRSPSGIAMPAPTPISMDPFDNSAEEAEMGATPMSESDLSWGGRFSLSVGTHRSQSHISRRPDLSMPQPA